MRQPIQVYLTPAERGLLDRRAAELGLSRSAVLRQGLRAIADAGSRTASDWFTPPSVAPGAPPPPSLPVAPLEQLLAELKQDRSGW